MSSRLLPEPPAADPRPEVASTTEWQTQAQRRLDALARLTARAARSPMALLAVVGTRTPRLTAQVDLPRVLLARGSALVPALCAQVVDEGPVAVPDLAGHPLGARSPLVATGIVQAFAGVPVFGLDPEPVGFLCVLDTVAHAWGTADLELLQDLAAAVYAELRCMEQQATLRDLVAGSPSA